jgi:FkbM family methyltransferase
VIRHFTPAGINQACKWKSRFAALGFDSSSAWRAALSRQMREALVASRIEHLPASLRSNLELVVDVGANNGRWISALLRVVAVGRIEAFEPNPEAFVLLEECLAARPATRLHELALGEDHGTADLNITGSSDLSSLLAPAEILSEQYTPAKAAVIKQVPVRVSPLDDVIGSDITVDLLKIDVQGFEHAVLRGARETLKRTRALLIETNFASHYLGDGSFGSLYSQITAELGFNFWDLSPPHRGTEGQALWADAVFVNPKAIGADA